MRLFLRLLIVVVILLPVVALSALWAAFQEQALVQPDRRVTPQQVERAMRVFRQHDPRRQRAGVPRMLVLAQADVDAGLAYAAERWRRAAAQAKLFKARAEIEATIDVGWPLLGRYLNLRVELSESPALPRVESFHVGRLRLPAFLAERLLAAGLDRLAGDGSASLPADLLRKVSFAEGRAILEYQWRDDTSSRLRGLAVSAAERERLRHWQAVLAGQVRDLPAGGQVSLATLAKGMLAEARRRSAGGEAAAELRALHVVLAFYVNEQGLQMIVPEARDWPRPGPREVTLLGRHDLAQHFSLSALIALAAGSPLADAIGVYKEVDDARHGSGFSFADLAADRAGTRFGEFAATRPEAFLARADRLAEDLIVPAVGDLPEYMPEAEFRRRFGGVGQPAYRQMTAEIERRIAALAFYR
jgi:hypothetical protein